MDSWVRHCIKIANVRRVHKLGELIEQRVRVSLVTADWRTVSDRWQSLISYSHCFILCGSFWTYMYSWIIQLVLLTSCSEGGSHEVSHDYSFAYLSIFYSSREEKILNTRANMVSVHSPFLLGTFDLYKLQEGAFFRLNVENIHTKLTTNFSVTR